MPVSRRTMLRLAAATPAALSLGAVADLGGDFEDSFG